MEIGIPILSSFNAESNLLPTIKSTVNIKREPNAIVKEIRESEKN
ncbi:hypothetical protein EV06_0963 [Prochlorococcus sp. MIT 0602]|nr:hypothetical protein EV06_0963 [Prochlorococcus sp. MIT 0602]KGG17371.1 hypothetical protein EV07_0809 [Prochlorococcus sp. MIT 0603]